MIDEIDDTDTSIPREVSGFGDVLEEGKESEHFHVTELKEQLPTLTGEHQPDDHEVDAINDRQDHKTASYDGDDSPFPEVRAAVSPVDDPFLPVNTVRFWAIGILFTIIGSGLNQLFSLRQPSVTISGLVAQLVAYPIGCAWARWVPLGVLNPDRKFNIKEHALITIMANVSFGSAGASQIIEAIVKFYNLPSQGGFEVLLMVTTQLFGFGLAGMFYPILVPPAKLLWPGILSNAALFSTLHSQTNVIADGWKIPRLRFFLYVFAIGGIWYLLPGFFFTALSYFTFICWILPTNLTVNQLFGQYSGLGMSMLTFDWAQVVYANQSPLLTPLWAGLNVFGGFVIFFWIICPILYYTNTWYSAYLPIMSPSIYDNTGKVYNTSRILDHNAELDLSAYQNYSPMFLPASFALTYGVAFANLTGIFVHLFLNHRDILSSSWKGDGKKDIHARLSARYERIPWWWFAGFTVMVFILTIVANVVWRTDLPIWAIFLSFILPLIYFVPVAIIKALTNISTNQLNLITEFIGGYAFLGKPIANMVFKFYGYVGLAQGIEFVADMKLAHYLHIPPRMVFLAQGLATFIGALVQCGVTVYMVTRVPDVCASNNQDGYTCPHGRVTYSASLIWGVLGPGRNFSPGQLYGSLLWFFLVGPLVVALTWLASRRWSVLRLISWPVVFGGMSLVPPATGVNFSAWWLVNVIFNGIIRRRKPSWWIKYNYVLSAALDSGVAISTVLIFFCLQLPGVHINWWGTEVSKRTADGLAQPWKMLPSIGYFGPSKGSWR